MKKGKIDIQGHRGCRGHYPENSIPAFIEALEMGVTTLEMDVVISKDNQVIVSHEPFLSNEICLDTTGQEIPDSLQKEYNVYEMSYSDIAKFDCGIKAHPRFPEQQNISVAKPLLKTVLDTVEQHLQQDQLPSINYNIEIKSTEEGDGIFHPTPKEFTELVIGAVKEFNLIDRVTLQSFDIRTLEYLHKNHPSIRLAYLVENEDGLSENLKKLSFTPDIYSCYFKLLSKEDVNQCKAKNMKVIPWTVNEPKDIFHVLTLNVDGIISDYPDRVVQAVEKK